MTSSGLKVRFAVGPARGAIDPVSLLPVFDGLERMGFGAVWLSDVPMGRTDLVAEGVSKFVLRPLGPVRNWDDELTWLADTVLDKQT